jgi:hypothetical protein
MSIVVTKMRGLGFILWQARHMGYHIMLGLLWAWFLRERWGEFNPKWIMTAVVGSVLPDIDHLNYFLGYGRHDTYTQHIFGLIKTKQWRNLTKFIAVGHKTNTSLAYHNVYMVGVFIGIAGLASLFDWEAGVVLFGAIVSHYLFDILDDFLKLGEMNANWKRWGKPKKA